MYKKIKKPILYIEISSAFHVKQVTGIQRVVRELVENLMSKKTKMSFRTIPIVYNSKKHIYNIPSIGNSSLLRKKKYLKIEELEDNNFFFDIDASWNNRLERSYLFPKLKEKNITIITMHYDIVPLIMPEVVKKETKTRFRKHLEASIKYSHLFICISKHAELELKNYVQKVYGVPIRTEVITLGSNFKITNTFLKSLKKVKKFAKQKYILSVGTIEPRKRQELTLEAYNEILKYEESLSIVFVGKKGWNDQDFENKVKEHPLWNKQVFWFHNLTDYELDFLYKNAFLSIYLTEYEGYGLPVAESLYYGIPTIINASSAVSEIGVGFVEKIDTLDLNSVIKAISKLLKKAYYKDNKDRIKNTYKPTLWLDSNINIINILNNIIKQRGK